MVPSLAAPTAPDRHCATRLDVAARGGAALSQPFTSRALTAAGLRVEMRRPDEEGPARPGRGRPLRAPPGRMALADGPPALLRLRARGALLSRVLLARVGRAHGRARALGLAGAAGGGGRGGRGRTRDRGRRRAARSAPLIPAAIVGLYLAVVVYIGVFAFRHTQARDEAEEFFLARRSLGPIVFVLSLFGTNMTAFSILGASGHAFNNGIVTYGLMASSSGLVVPLSLFFIGTRLWAIGKKHGHMTPVQIFRGRWETSHVGTVIFAVQAALLVPYIIIGVMGGGTTLSAISGGLVPYWLGGAVVAVVVMIYVFFGGMRGTAWVNTFQTILFLGFGAVALAVIGFGMGGFRTAAEALLASPATAPLLTRERVSPAFFFSDTLLPLSSIHFSPIAILCLAARRMAQFKRTVVPYPLCLMAVWVPSVFLGVMANRATDVPALQEKIDARRTLPREGSRLPPEERA